MEFMWLVPLGLALIFYGGCTSRVKRLEMRVKRLERKLKGDDSMSKIIESLIGKKCNIAFSSGLSSQGTIIEADEEWVKLSIEKKDKVKTVISRIDDIHEINLID